MINQFVNFNPVKETLKCVRCEGATNGVFVFSYGGETHYLCGQCCEEIRVWTVADFNRLPKNLKKIIVGKAVAMTDLQCVECSYSWLTSAGAMCCNCDGAILGEITEYINGEAPSDCPLRMHGKEEIQW